MFMPVTMALLLLILSSALVARTSATRLGYMMPRADVPQHGGARRLQQVLPSSGNAVWIVVSVGVGVLALILILVLCVVFDCFRPRQRKARKAKQRANKRNSIALDDSKSQMDQQEAMAGPSNMGGGSTFVPRYAQEPGSGSAGFQMNSVVATEIKPYCSPPRESYEPPYQRLLVLSSRVQNPQQVIQALNGETAVVMYNWAENTLQGLLSNIMGVIVHPDTRNTIVSVAIIGPSNTGKSVNLLDGHRCTAKKLMQQPELLHFWKSLASCVKTDEYGYGGRVDLLGCRLLDDETSAAELLRLLWIETDIPFAASDDAVGGYPLSTFGEDPVTQEVSIVSTPDVMAVDIYFDREVINTMWNMADKLPGSETAGTARLASLSDALKRGGLNEPLRSSGTGRLITQSKQLETSTDIFARLLATFAGSSYVRPSFVQACAPFVSAATGRIQISGILQMMKSRVTSSIKNDAHLYAYMLLCGFSNGVEPSDVYDACKEGARQHLQMRRILQKDSEPAKPEDYDILPTFAQYVQTTLEMFQQLFSRLGQGPDERIAASEVHTLIKHIPNLDAFDQQLIMAYLYECTQFEDGSISYREFQGAFTEPAWTYAMSPSI